MNKLIEQQIQLRTTAKFIVLHFNLLWFCVLQTDFLSFEIQYWIHFNCNSNQERKKRNNCHCFQIRIAGLKDVPFIDVKIMDKENIYRSRLVKQEDSCHYLFKITWVLPISKTSEGVLTVFIATPIYLLNRWCIQTRSAFLFRAFNRTYYNCFVEIFSSMHFVLLFVSFVILTSDNITKRISANEYAIKANSKTHVIDFCNNAGCNFVKQVSITISYQITFFFFSIMTCLLLNSLLMFSV